MRRMLLTILTCGLLTNMAMPVSALTFSDIQGHWAESAINQVSDLGLFQGDGEFFLPDDTMTRGMFITVLARLAERQGLEVDTSGSTSFVDIPAGAYYEDYAVWACNNQIVSGLSDTQFAPDAPVTREQMCTILVRFLNWAQVELPTPEEETGLFLDQSAINDYATDSVAISQEVGLIQGVSVDGGMEFQPQAGATRSAVATVFIRLMSFLDGESQSQYSQEEIETEAEIASYLSVLIERYCSSAYLATTDEVVQETMATLMSCLEDALEEREQGAFLTRDFVQETYGDTIAEMKVLYDQLTEEQYNQFFNVVVRLGTTDQIYAVMDFFGVSYVG